MVELFAAQSAVLLLSAPPAAPPPANYRVPLSHGETGGCLLEGFRSVQSLSRVGLCDPTDCSTPGFPVHHQLPELTQTDVHQVRDAIQPSHPLSAPSPLAFNLSQDQGLF